jgi:O-antigen biosynthesis protein
MEVNRMKAAGQIRRPRKSSVRQKQRRRTLTNRERYDAGYAEGYRQGAAAGSGSYGSVFEGTSIIIPTYNQAEYLRQCIDAITDHTDLPYEIIVIDNASTDGTADYLESARGSIRYRILETNLGFAAAVNRGLMMAKGSTIVLLNNDTLVTDRWLDNMLRCLTSDERIGMVGPVTNYIGGTQQIEVPYKSTKEMFAYASARNQSNPAVWMATDRLVGFCLLFRRELWERTGYLDEGFRIGNFEDDDYNVRVRLQGYRLVIAQDAFIHHFGSVSTRALGDRLQEIYEGNERYYSGKWGNPHALIHRVKQTMRLRQPGEAQGEESLTAFSETDFYPQFVIVRGIGDTAYWIAHGERRPITGPVPVPIVRLSMIDIRRWRLGPEISGEEAAAAWAGAGVEQNLDSGTLAYTPEGTPVYLEAGVVRPIASSMALEAWYMAAKPVVHLTAEQLAERAEGLPIIAPIRLAQVL